MIKLFFERLSRYERKAEPTYIAVPFKRGELYDTFKLGITDKTVYYPAQYKITARWEDGSIKWLHIFFLADLPANKSAEYFLNTDCKENIKRSDCCVDKNKGGIVINAAGLKLSLAKAGEGRIFSKIQMGGISFDADEIEGPIVTDKNGSEYTIKVGEKGWSVIENGPVRCIAETHGKHFDTNKNAYFDYVLRVNSYASKPWIKLDYQIINREANEKINIYGKDYYAEYIHGIELRIKLKGENSNASTTIAISNHETKYIFGNGEQKLYKLIDAEYIKNDNQEHLPETIYGTFMADWRNGGRGIAATIYQPHQNFPKAIEATKDGIIIKLLPKEHDGIEFARGVAKTHSVFLHFHGGKEEIQKIGVRSIQFQMPDRPVIDSEIYKNAGVFEDIYVDKKQMLPQVETRLINLADNRYKAYGMLNFGDGPDPIYTEEGRANGELVWTNNEYDLPHAAMLMYARNGDRKFLDYVLAACRHWIDVDICHSSDDEYRIGAHIEHSGRHITGAVEPSHEWVEGLFDYYHMTGDQFAYDAAMGVADNILKMLTLPIFQKKGAFNVRETGWALRALVSIYKETNDKKWLEPCEKIVDQFIDWSKEYGGLLASYTDHMVIRIPFMIAVVTGSLMRYYSVNPRKDILKLVVSAADDLIENAMIPNTGLFYHKELPSIRKLGHNALPLETMADAYFITGDKKYIEAGLNTFKNFLKINSLFMPIEKTIYDKNTVLMLGEKPKLFPQALYPIIRFYKAVIKSGTSIE